MIGLPVLLLQNVLFLLASRNDCPLHSLFTSCEVVATIKSFIRGTAKKHGSLYNVFGHSRNFENKLQNPNCQFENIGFFLSPRQLGHPLFNCVKLMRGDVAFPSCFLVNCIDRMVLSLH